MLQLIQPEQNQYASLQQAISELRDQRLQLQVATHRNRHSLQHRGYRTLVESC